MFEDLDRTDPLARFRERFHIPLHEGREVAYFCGNSLGLMPKQAREDVERELRAWQDLGVEGHFKPDRPWVSFHERFAGHLAKLVGAKPTEVVAMNTLTVNLHLMLASFYRPTPSRYKVLTAHSAFPSDRYALASRVAADAIVTVHPRPGEATLRTEEILAKITDDIALVLMDGVNYYTGEFLDIPAITEAARKRGIIVGLDLAHAVGNVPLRLHEWGVDFAVWCSYKYLNGGPGCCAGCFVHERHGPDTPRLAGWWGHDKATRFQMGPSFHAMPGAEGWQLSNPPLFSLAALQASCEIFSEAGMEALRAKSVALTGLLEEGLRTNDSIEILTPGDPERRGCQLSIRMKQNGRETHARLQREGIICDWREPDVLRLAPVPLYSRYADVERCLNSFSRDAKALRSGARGPRTAPQSLRVAAKQLTIVGGGLAGSLLALMLARRGIHVTVYERRHDLRKDVIEEGRSINLALSARGIHALARVNLDREVLAQAIPMRGRYIHPLAGECSLIPYGRTADEVIHSVSRRGLNAQLLEALANEPNATVHFRTRCTGYNFATKALTLRDEASSKEFTVEAPVVIGTDGASSALRNAMMGATRMDFSQEYLEHSYKELTLPPLNGEYQLEPNALHIWPRGGFMMIALPNLDRTFTCTLFLAQSQFASLETPAKVREFFASTFPDAVPLMPGFDEEFFRNPTGGLITVKCSPWHIGGQALLLGDAAHAIVPFFGQGMNCAFEDCEALLDLFDEHNGDWAAVFPKVDAARKANADAIARMALDNFIEMRDTSGDPRFAKKRKLEHALEERFPGTFFSKYSMVSFQRFPYAEALARGQKQDAILMAACEQDTPNLDAVFNAIQQ